MENKREYCPRLIEVAMPIREISVESVRDKSLRHGHISTLHLWWARRPLPASRAVVFASLVPDPEAPNCPAAFREAVEKNLKTEVPPELKYYQRGRDKLPDKDPYKPYEGLQDTLRNRLITFIAKWSPEMLAFEDGKSEKIPTAKLRIDDRSLVKWETSDPDNPQGQTILRIARELVQAAYHGQAPSVLDPFAGGGAIPLEAGRIGAKPIANDYNPVAYLILRATCEFPQKYGKPGKRNVEEEDQADAIGNEREVPNVLAHDVEKWANWNLERAKEKIGHLYPAGEDGRPVIGYLWARTAPCSNPSCRGQIPLLRSLLVCNKKNKKVALTMDVDQANKTVSFGIARGKDIQRTDGTTVSRGVKCPFCDQVTHSDTIKEASFDSQLGEKIVAVIVEGGHGKDYRPAEQQDFTAFKQSKTMGDSILTPSEAMPNSPDLISGRGWNFLTWGSLFNPRQLVAMQTFIESLHEALDEMDAENYEADYSKAVGVCLGLWVSRVAQRSSNMGLWDTSRETLQHPFGRQAIPMTWDYPEANPFSEQTGGAIGQLRWILRFIPHESDSGIPAAVNAGDAGALALDDDSVSLVVTDPPYFDAIAYSDLSDFFYVWLKRSLGEAFPEALVTPLTPKGEEATALKHRNDGNATEADEHFTKKLAEACSESLRVLKPKGIVTIMFAHQSTKAWSALINAIFDAGLTVDATWPIDTELTTALKAKKSALSSSVTVICRPRMAGSAASFKHIRKEVEKVVRDSVKRFWSYGFRGADLIVACYGPAVGVFGKYERVEKADGTPVEVPELLRLAQEAARDAIAGEFRGDNLSTFYYVWANLYGPYEQDWDDARLVVQIGGEEDNAMELARNQGVFELDGSKCRLAMLADREGKTNLGKDRNPPLIDALHRSMILWKQEKRSELVKYLAEREMLEDGPFWHLAQALFEVLPRDREDWKITSALLGERSTLRREGKSAAYRQDDWFS